MTDKSTRVVLAIYSSAEDAERAYRTARAADTRRQTLLVTAGAHRASHSKLNRYLELLLEGESAVAVAAPPPEIQALVKDLRGSGEPSIFMLPEEIPEAGPSSRSATSAMSIAEMA